MKIQSILLLFLVCLTQWAAAQSVSEKMSAAHEAFMNGQYQEAQTVYEGLVEEGYNDASLHYNLGSTYYKLEQVGPAVLHLEKAQKLAPTDKTIKGNLLLSKKRIKNKVEDYPVFFYQQWWKSITHLFSSTIWAILAILLFWAAFWVAYQFVKAANTDRKKQFFAATVAIGFLWLFVFIVGFSKYRTETDNTGAIVYTDDVVVKKGPSTASKDVSPISAGNKLRILEESGEWVKVRMTDDQEGWVQVAAIRRI